MARPKKLGFDYFSVDTTWDSEMEAVALKFGANGIGVITCLWQLCFRENGYFTQWSEIKEEVFTGKTKVTSELFRIILEYSFKLGLFDLKMFEEFGIITGHGVQNRYLTMCAVSKRTPEIDKNLRVIPEVIGINPENSGKSTQSKVNKRKPKKTKPKEIKENETKFSGEKPDVQEIVEENEKVETVILEPEVITEPGPEPKPETQVQKAAKIWEAHRELNDMGKFLWEGAETGSLKKLLAKIEAKMITQELPEPTEQDVLNGLGHFFNNRRIWGKWLCDQWTLQTINSKFDDIYHNIKKHYGNGKQQSTAAELEQKIRDNAYALAKKRGYKEPGNDPQ